MKKTVGAQLKANEIVVLADLDSVQRLDGGLGLALRGAESGEIMLAAQLLCRR